LRELKKDFEKVSKEKQPLVLFPGMIPGQGVAQVIVDAKPLIDREVELDFSKMTEAKKDDKPVTMDSLENQIKGSYPIDFPDVEASEAEYSRIKDIVQSFAEDKTETLKGDCF